MLILERQEKIIEYLKAHKSEKTAALARAMYVSEATVRRDIAEMEKLGLVRRSHGGVVLFENSNDEPSIAIRMNEMEAEKQKIARLALPLLKPFRTLFLDSSSTVSVLAKHFHEQHKTVISTGIQAVTFLSGKENVDVFLPGGFLSRLIVTYAYICFSINSTYPRGMASTSMECSPTALSCPELRWYT